MYLQSLLIFLLLSILFFNYQPNNQCILELTNTMSSNYPINTSLSSLNTKQINITNSHTFLIPKLIVQTNQKDQMPGHMVKSIEKIIQINPDYSYRFFNSTERRDFIEQFMDKRILKAYDKLIPKAFQADLWRYCVIYHFGGCYMDSGSFTIRKLSDVLSQNDTFVSTLDARGWGINSAFFCASKNHPILKQTIDDVVEAVQKEFYGQTAIEVTGPQRFGSSFKKYLNIEKQSGLSFGSYPGGVKLFNRNVSNGCLIASLDDGISPFILSKYPSYYSDMKWYANEQRYQEQWKSRQMYNRNTD